MNGTPGSQAYFASLYARHRDAGHGERGKLVKEAAEFLNCSEHRIYTELKKFKPNTDRKSRSDRGISKLNKEQAEAISNLMMQSCRDNKKQLMTCGDAIEVAFCNEILTERVSIQTAGREMMRHGVHPRQLAQPASSVTQQSLHPNHVWQFDVSFCVLYYLRDREGLHVMPEDEFYKNKPANLEKVKKHRVLRYLVTDHYSGAFYVEYFHVPGENQHSLFDFLMSAFHQRHPKDPLHGVPEIIVWDAGTANTSHMIEDFLKRLEVRTITHEPGNPRAKGQVEGTHNLVERHFEGLLYMQQVNSIEQLNELAHAWMRHYNAKQVMRRHGHSRYGLWQTIRKEQLRLSPSIDICRAVLQQQKPEPRLVSSELTIQYAPKVGGSHMYKVEQIPNVRAGDTVLVYMNPYRSPNIDVIFPDYQGADVTYECEPVRLNAAGFPIDAPVIGEEYKPTRDTDTDTARKRMDKAAYNAETKLEVKKKRKQRQPAFEGKIDPFAHIDKDPAADYMTKQGETLPITAPRFEKKKLNNIQAQKRIHKRLGGMLDEKEKNTVKDILRSEYPNGITTDELDALIENLEKDHAEIKNHVGEGRY